MTKLTLPIVVGKKYVRRDGKIVIARAHHKFVTVFADDEARSSHPFSHMAFPSTGRIDDEGEPDTARDLVSDYIEPAKGHPHAALMAQFAEDAKETETPQERWQWKRAEESLWRDCEDMLPTWSSWLTYRRKPIVTPDPHAASAAEYAKDMAETDKAWERWEMYLANSRQFGWMPCQQHPTWVNGITYRRRSQS